MNYKLYKRRFLKWLKILTGSGNIELKRGGALNS
jgi:hypothetical protein